MVKKLQFSAIVILLSTVHIESFTSTGILQQVKPEKCVACMGKLIFDLEYIKVILDKTYSAGAITTKDVQNPSLLDQLTHNQPNSVKRCDCKKNCAPFSIYTQTRDNIKKLTDHEALLKAYNTVYWYEQCQKNLAGLTTGLNKLSYIDRVKYVKAIEPDLKQCEKVTLNPELKSELKRNITLVESTIKQLKTEKF